MKKRGKDLRVGDAIAVWWAPRTDMITELKPYTGPLLYLFPEGAQSATFLSNGTGMTIDNSDEFTILARKYKRPA